MNGRRLGTVLAPGILAVALASCAPRPAFVVPGPPREVGLERAAHAKGAGPGGGRKMAEPPLPEAARGPDRAVSAAPPPAPTPLPAAPRPDPETSYARAIARSRQAIAGGTPADAVPAWEALEGTAMEGDALFHQGVLLQLAGDAEGAAARYRRAARRDPPHDGAAANLIGILLLKGTIEEALSLAERARKDPAATPALRANAAAVLLDAGRLDESEALMREVRENGASPPSLAWNLAVLDWRRGDAASARVRAAALPPDVAGLWPVVASRRAWEGDGGDPALGAPSFPEARMEALSRNLAARAEFSRGDAAAAERLLAPLAAAGDFPGEVLTNLGLLQAEQGRWLEAKENLERAVRARPDLPHAWLNLGRFRDIYLGDPGGARECYLRYIELNGPRREEVRKWAERLGSSAPRGPSP